MRKYKISKRTLLKIILPIVLVILSAAIFTVSAWFLAKNEISINGISVKVNSAQFNMTAVNVKEIEFGVPGENKFSKASLNGDGFPTLTVNLKAEGNRAFVYCIEFDDNLVPGGEYTIICNCADKHDLGTIKIKGNTKNPGNKFYGIWTATTVTPMTVGLPVDIHFHGRGVIDTAHVGSAIYDGNDTQGHKFTLPQGLLKITYCQATPAAVNDVFNGDVTLIFGPSLNIVVN